MAAYIVQIVVSNTEMERDNIIKVCKHENTIIKVLDAVCGCENTVEFCTDCNKPISEPKIEC